MKISVLTNQAQQVKYDLGGQRNNYIHENSKGFCKCWIKFVFVSGYCFTVETPFLTSAYPTLQDNRPR